jgi:hypothetical protein
MLVLFGHSRPVRQHRPRARLDLVAADPVSAFGQIFGAEHEIMVPCQHMFAIHVRPGKLFDFDRDVLAVRFNAVLHLARERIEATHKFYVAVKLYKNIEDHTQ